MAPANHATAGVTSRVELLVVVDAHACLLGCLCLWLETFGDGFEIVGVPDIRQVLRDDQIGQARAILFGPGTSAAGGSLDRQVSWPSKRQPNAAIAAIAPDDDDRPVDRDATVAAGIHSNVLRH